MKLMWKVGLATVLACFCLVSCKKKVADAPAQKSEMRKDAQALLGMWMLPEGYEYLEVKQDGGLVLYDKPGGQPRHTGQYRFLSPGVIEWRWTVKSDTGGDMPSPWLTVDFEVGGNPTRLAWCSRVNASRSMRYYVKYERP